MATGCGTHLSIACSERGYVAAAFFAMYVSGIGRLSRQVWRILQPPVDGAVADLELELKSKVTCLISVRIASYTYTYMILTNVYSKQWIRSRIFKAK